MSQQQAPAKPKTKTDRTAPNAHDDVLLDREAIAMDTDEATVSPAMAPNGNATIKPSGADAESFKHKKSPKRKAPSTTWTNP